MEQSTKAVNYRLKQVIGSTKRYQKVQQEDIISTLQFDLTGKHIALGDKDGRVIIFKAEQTNKGTPHYQYLTEFQSHWREFDPLNSMWTTDEVKKVNWLREQGKYLKMITSNEKNIKIWKIFEKTDKKIVKPSGKNLQMPKLQNSDIFYTSQLQKIFPMKHSNPIHSTQISYNEQYLISGDESHIFLWSLQKPQKPFLTVNYNEYFKQSRQHNITCTKYHPNDESLFAYGDNKGNLKMVDLRLSADSRQSSLSFGEQDEKKNYLYQLLSSYSSIDIMKNGKYVVSRDCLTVKLWDVCNPIKPVVSYTLNDGLKQKLSEMVEKQVIFDKFQVCASKDGSTIVSGSYNNCFHLLDVMEGANFQYELSYKKNTLMKKMGRGNILGKMDYQHKVTSVNFSNDKSTVAVASLDTFFVYAL